MRIQPTAIRVLLARRKSCVRVLHAGSRTAGIGSSDAHDWQLAARTAAAIHMAELKSPDRGATAPRVSLDERMSFQRSELDACLAGADH
jgi:hypothetical protein